MEGSQLVERFADKIMFEHSAYVVFAVIAIIGTVTAVYKMAHIANQRDDMDSEDFFIPATLCFGIFILAIVGLSVSIHTIMFADVYAIKELMGTIKQ